MNRTKRLILIIIIVVLIGLAAIIAGVIFLGETSILATGDKHILVCAIDESETRAGMGACDMAFIVSLNNGTLKDYTAFYPGGMRHPTAAEPEEYQKQGAGAKLLMHDAFYDADNSKGLQYAKEIVESNKGVKIDNVVAVNSQGLDAVLAAAGPLEVNGQQTNASAIDIIREEDWNQGVSRGEAVLDIVKAAANKAKDSDTKNAMINAAMDQFTKGNIIMDKQGDFAGLLASKGIETFFH
ncbi:DUF4012 domain-containing protein [Methanobrevibacter sp.]|uniref:DUF4012 domain-containing protein n=1 Tax=Methanobrevibacter sp. TaxID=66852 RepID=UPI00388EBE5C